jgi:hypothetical protein
MLSISTRALMICLFFLAVAHTGVASAQQGVLPPLDEERVPRGFEVTHIMLDHRGPDTNIADGLNVRKDLNNDLGHTGNGVGKGEWIRGSRNEPALYVAGATVTIKVRLKVAAQVNRADIAAQAKFGLLPNVAVKTVNFVGGVSNPPA